MYYILIYIIRFWLYCTALVDATALISSTLVSIFVWIPEQKEDVPDTDLVYTALIG